MYMENPSERSFFGVLKTIFQSKTANLFILLLIVAAVPLTVFVAQQQQEVRQKADELRCECKYNILGSGRPEWNGYGCSLVGIQNGMPCTGFENTKCSNYRTSCIDNYCQKPNGSLCGDKCLNTNSGVDDRGRRVSCEFEEGGRIAQGECSNNKRCVASSQSSPSPTQQPPSQQQPSPFPSSCSSDCDDNNPCTWDGCDTYTGACGYSNKPRGTDCGNSKVCNDNGKCVDKPTDSGGGGTRPSPGGGQQPGDRTSCAGCEKDGNEFPQCGGTLHNKPCSASTTEVDQHNLIMVQKMDCPEGERWSTTDVTDDSQCGGTGGESPSERPPATGANGNLKYTCGPSWPNNKLSASWDLGGGNNCNVFIQGGTTPHKINGNNECQGQKEITQFEDGSRITNDGIYALYVSNGQDIVNVKNGEVGPLPCGPEPSAPPASCNPDAVNMTVAPADSTKTEIKVGDRIKFNVSGSQGSTWISEQGLSGFTDCTGGIWGDKTCKALKEGQDIAWTHNWKNCAGSAANCPVSCAKNAKFTIKSSASAIPACDKTKVTMTAKSIEDPLSADIFVNDNIRFNVTGEQGQGTTHPQDVVDQNPTGIIDFTGGFFSGTTNFKARKTGVVTWVRKWRNCAVSDLNCSSTVCSSDPVLVNIQAVPNFRVEGVIFNDADGNQEQNGGETGLPGIIVKLTNEDTNANFTAGASGADGKFVFESIPRGNRYKGEVTNIPANNYITVNYPVRASIRANITGFKIGIRQNPIGAKEIKGKLNAVSDCNVGITGYACIPNETSTQLNVDIFDYSGAKLGTARADKQNSTSECQGSHKFVFDVPSLLKDGNPHSIYAHAINIINGQNPELTGSPQTFTCTNPAELDGEDGINIGDFNVLLSKYKSKENINSCTTSRSNICS